MRNERPACVVDTNMQMIEEARTDEQCPLGILEVEQGYEDC